MKLSTCKSSLITAKQHELLEEAYKRQVENLAPIGVYYTQSAKGLVKKGLFEPQDYKIAGKVLTCFFLTEAGHRYLSTGTIKKF